MNHSPATSDHSDFSGGSCCAHVPPPPGALHEADKAPSTEPGTITTIHVAGMRCGSCVQRVEGAVKALPGVDRVEVRLADQTVTVYHRAGALTSQQLETALAEAGYPAVHGRTVQDSASKLFRQRFRTRPVHIGTVTAIAVVVFYLGLLTLVSSWDNARFQFADNGIWILALALGLGFQVSLFSALKRHAARSGLGGAKGSVAASGGVSTLAMALCCSHYFATLLPLIGLPFLSAAAAGLAVYQVPFFILGVVSNLFGIGLIYRQMLRRRLSPAMIFANQASA